MPETNILAKIEKLLSVAERHAAEAERNPAQREHYMAEAENATALAQNLMAQHAIEAHMLRRAERPDERPITKTLSIPFTWFRQDIDLLTAVARANGCDGHYASPRYSGPGSYTLVGFEDDIANVEVIYGSLKIQLTRLCRGLKSPFSGVSDNRYQRGFRNGFALGIEVRLMRSTKQAEEEAGKGETLPALIDRDQLVNQAMPKKLRKATETSYGVGAKAGLEAAETVDVGDPGLSASQRALNA